MVAALIPALNDKTLEHVLEAASAAGAKEAAYVIMRLPNELKVLFKEWLAAHYPQRADHVISIVHQMRGGRDNDPNFGTRMSGTGQLAELLAERFRIACERLGFNRSRHHGALDAAQFKPPSRSGQMSLF
jgi:DNA repair photolyase